MKLKYKDAGHEYYLQAHGANKLIRCKGVTSVAGIPDDKWALDQWAKRMIVEGFGYERSLAEEAERAIGERDSLQKLAEKALTAAKAHDKAERGTQLHRVLERYDLGDIAETESMVTDVEQRAARAGWEKALKAGKITLDPDYIERILVWPQHRIAGRMDRFVQVGRAKSHTVLDLKTGKIDYPHKIAIQLAAYAYAPHMAGLLDEYGITETFTELPDMDLKWALVAHMPTPGEIDIVKIDIAAGYKAFQDICLKTIAWRANKSLVKPFVSVEVEDPIGRASEAQILAIKERLRIIAQTGGAEAKSLTIRKWPTGVDTPARAAEWTIGDLDVLHEALHRIEAEVGVPF